MKDKDKNKDKNDKIKALRNALNPPEGGFNEDKYMAAFNYLKSNDVRIGYAVPNLIAGSNFPAKIIIRVHIGGEWVDLVPWNLNSEQLHTSQNAEDIAHTRTLSGIVKNKMVNTRQSAKVAQALNMSGINLSKYLSTQLGFDRGNWKEKQTVEMDAGSRDLMLAVIFGMRRYRAEQENEMEV